MESMVASCDTAEALSALRAAIDVLIDTDLTPVDTKEAGAIVTEFEVELRRLNVVGADLMGDIDRSGTYEGDGHRSAKTMVRYAARLSGQEAHRRNQTARALQALPEVATAARRGAISTCAVRRIARAYGNPRIADELEACQERLVIEAGRMSHKEFDGFVTDLVNLIDQDGARDRNDYNHRRRNATVAQHYDTGWSLHAEWAALDGARFADIFEHYVGLERLADWEDARASHGDAATPANLARSEAQRRADALLAMAERAAVTPPGAKGGGIVTHIVIDWHTYQTLLLLLASVPARQPDELELDGYRCSTLDGRRLEPTEAMVASLLGGHVSRVVVGADSVPIDWGRNARLFTGPARLAAQLTSSECIWPGCHLPATLCQVDHLVPHSDGGRTNPQNGGPACAFHNRWKHQHGFTVWRDPAGRWHTYRPDGTEI